MKKYLLARIFLSAFLPFKAQASPFFYSPGGKITFNLSIQDNKLLYSVSYNKSTIIETSLLDLTINGKPLISNISFGNITKQNVDETYQYRGIHSKAINKYAGAKISMNGSMPF